MTKILFLDLYGTVRESASGARFISKPHDQRLMKGVKEAIAHYKDWVIIGITNQGGVAAGHKSLEDAIDEQLFTLKLIPEMQNIFLCPDYEGRECWMVDQWMAKTNQAKPLHLAEWAASFVGRFRKPGTGMIRAANRLMGTELVSSDYWMIGDREEDALCAATAGINFMWADVWRDRFHQGEWEIDLSSRHISKEILLKFLAT